MVEFRNNICSVDGRLEPSKYLDLEVSSDQNKLLNLAEQDIRRSTIFQEAMMKSNRKLATRKLNIIGNMAGHCSVLTSNENIKRAREDCRLASTYEEINERQRKEKNSKKKQKRDDLIQHYTTGLERLVKMILIMKSSQKFTFLGFYCMPLMFTSILRN